MHCCLWWTFWTFVTVNVKIAQFSLILYVNYEHSECVFFPRHSVSSLFWWEIKTKLFTTWVLYMVLCKSDGTD
jgi:hypothetical protein